MIALWLGSAGLKKIEAGNSEIKKQFKADMEKMQAELETKVTTVTNKVNKFDAQMGGITEGQTKAKETSASLQKELAQLRKELNDLLFRLPPQFRAGQPATPTRRDFG